MKVVSYLAWHTRREEMGTDNESDSSQSQVSELRLSLYRVILNSESSSSHQFENEQQFGEIAERLPARPLERVIEYAESSRQYSRSLSTTSEHSERFLAVFQCRPRGHPFCTRRTRLCLLSKLQAGTGDEPCVAH